PWSAAWARASLTRPELTSGRELTGIWHNATRIPKSVARGYQGSSPRSHQGVRPRDVIGLMSRPLLNRRLEGLGTTIFAEMSARALVTGSVNLGQGFPDGEGPAKTPRVPAAAIRAGRGNQYPPGPGVPELR